MPDNILTDSEGRQFKIVYLDGIGNDEPNHFPFAQVVPNSEPWFAAMMPDEKPDKSDKITLYRVVAWGVDHLGTAYPLTPRAQLATAGASRSMDEHEILIYFKDEHSFCIELSISDIEDIWGEKLDWEFIQS